MLLRTRSAIDECELHLNDSGAWNTEVESYLTQYILVILCADVQQTVYKLLDARISDSKSKDLGLKSFAYSMGVRCLRSFVKSELSKFLALFGDDVRESFNARLDDRVVTTYNNAVSKRHDVAHNSGVTTTFRELSDIYLSAVTILQAMDASLNRVGAGE
ncbi:HEPN domain-containing protein [Pseudomonas syringae]|uniref:HEPN domain-containing protein n=1 Tax=Pseudomonas syringae TaxID=317 RepID=UPI001187711F|nr:HEPN domain-containing protein [Pseudomonas syringae]MCK9730201.1 hypothetical protein [Pseudomonas syringae pv. syringae]